MFNSVHSKYAINYKLAPVDYLARAVALACLSFSGVSVAQTLAPVTVQSDWLGPPTEESVKAYTGARTVLEKEDLEERGALNLEDALRRVPGVQVLDETGTGILPNIGVRGLNPLRSERLQILVDGGVVLPCITGRTTWAVC